MRHKAWRVQVPDASRLAEKRFHYAWVVAAVTFLVLLVTAGIRATPGVLMVPLEGEFGWSNASISAAVAINIALFGLIGPFAASLMDRFGLRRIVLCALALLAVSVGHLRRFGHRCDRHGVVANRWFETHRGLVLGILTAANATGQLLFLPVLARLVDAMVGEAFRSWWHRRQLLSS